MSEKEDTSDEIKSIPISSEKEDTSDEIKSIPISSEKEDTDEIKSTPISELEEMFKHRYTDDDVDYVKLKEKPLPPPPIVCPFDQIRPRRNRDRGFERRTDQRYDGGDRRYRGQRYNSPHWSNNDRRDRSTSWDRQRNWERGHR